LLRANLSHNLIDNRTDLIVRLCTERPHYYRNHLRMKLKLQHQ
jgi:hypothetical protein